MKTTNKMKTIIEKEIDCDAFLHNLIESYGLEKAKLGEDGDKTIFERRKK